MKSTVLITLVFALSLSSAFGALSRVKYNDPKNPGKCTVSEKIILSEGESAKDPQSDCANILCEKNGNAVIQSCGVQVLEGCTMGDYIDKSRPYPECCERKTSCVK